ncbi:MAG: sugar ABC transporter substrate-binding protein [Sumerlaeia bacterium]
MSIRTMLISLLFAASLVLGGCGSPSTGPESDGGTTITFVTMQLQPTFNDYFADLIAEFEKENPGVKIDWVDYPFANYDTKLLTNFLGRDVPDVVNLSAEKLPIYVDGGHLEPLGEHLTSATLASYVPKLLDEGGRRDGSLYALPWYFSTYITYYNTALLEQAGLPAEPVESLDDLPEFAAAIKEKTGEFGFYPAYTENGELKNWLVQRGVPLISEDGKKAAFNTPEGVAVLAFWADLYQADLVPKESLIEGHRAAMAMYKRGELAVLRLGQEFVSQIEKDAPDIFAQTMVAPEPIWPEAENNVVSMHVVAVTKRSANPDVAAKFAAFVTNAENQLEFCKNATILPSSQEALASPYFTEPDESLASQARAIAAAQAENGVIVRLPEQTQALQRVFEDITEKVARGAMSPEEGIAAAEEQWNAILARD